MSLSKKGRLGDHSLLHGFDTSERGFNTEVLTPDNSSQPVLTGESSITKLPDKKRILILANKGNKQSTRVKRSYKTITTKEYYKFGDYNFAINSNKSGCYTQILKSLVSQTLAMQSLYKRILFMRFDLHEGFVFSDNKRITTLLKRLRKRLIHRYGNTKFGYQWVREESKNKGLHYHFVFMMDGDLVRYPLNIHEQVRKIWTDLGGPVFHFANHHFINSEEKLRDAILHGSYLAKVHSKGNRPDQTKDTGSSRLSV